MTRQEGASMMRGGTRGRPARWLCAAALLGVGAVAGCSDGEESAAGEEQVDYSLATEPPRTFIERTARLLATTTDKKDCAGLDAINSRSYTRLACPATTELRRSMARFKVVGAQTYGTGAVIDYKSGQIKDGAAILLFVSPSREWAISRFGVVTPPSTKTDDRASRRGFEKVVHDYLKAVRKRDCQEFIATVFFAPGENKRVCSTTFAETAGLARRLKSNPSAVPKYEGGNGTFGFFTLETSKPKAQNLTFSVIRAAGNALKPYMVLHVGLSPTAAVQRSVREELRQQQKRAGPSTKEEPSSKPSDPSVKP